jgi:hypothetical protein
MARSGRVPSTSRWCRTGRRELTPSSAARRRGRGGKLWRGEEGGTSAIAGGEAGREAMGIGQRWLEMGNGGLVNAG